VENPKGKFLGVIPSRQAVTGNARVLGGVHALGTGPLTYHGGPVLHTSNVYAIFWKPAAFTLPAGYQATIAQYFTDVAKFSFKPSNVYGSATQYYDITGTVKQPVFYSVASKLAIADPQPYPASGCPNYQLDDGTTSSNCLTDAQITAEIARVITAHALPTGVNNNYFLFTPQNVASCFTANGLSTGGCYDPIAFPGYCAYHSSFLLASKNVLWADMPYAALAGCDSGQSPENNAADPVLNTVAHEHIETLTDPLGTGWWDDTGDEIADKCNGDFGAPLGTNAFGQFNQVINAGIGEVANSVFKPTSKWYVKTDYPDYDPAAAAALVAEYKADTGKTPTFTLGTTPSTINQQAVQLLQSDFNAAGMDVTVKTTEQSSFISDGVLGNYQVNLWRQFGAVDPDADGLWWYSANTGDGGAQGGLALNIARNKDPQIDAALDQGRQSTDQATRQQAYATLQQRMAADIPYIWLNHALWAVIANNNVRGITNGPLPDGQPSLPIGGGGDFGGVVRFTQTWLTTS